jgi:hypothetical protein
MVSYLGHQNHASLVCRWRHKTDAGEVDAGHPSRSSGLLDLKQVLLRFFNLTSRLAQARRRVVHVASSQRLRRVEAKDGRIDTMDYVGPVCPKITVFYVLGRAI